MSFFRKLFAGQAPLFFFDPKKPKGERWSKGEISSVSLPLGLERLLNPLPVAVGDEVRFTSGTGTVLKVDGDDCTVRTEAGDVVVKRQTVLAITSRK